MRHSDSTYVTTVGRLMNRLTSDMNTVRWRPELGVHRLWLQLIGFISCIVVILSSTPTFLAFGSAALLWICIQLLPVPANLAELKAS